MQIENCEPHEIYWKIQIEDLNQQLRQFGLNPNEWTLIHDLGKNEENKYQFRILNKKNKSLSMIGNANVFPKVSKNSKPCWNFIELQEAS